MNKGILAVLLLAAMIVFGCGGGGGGGTTSTTSTTSTNSGTVTDIRVVAQIGSNRDADLTNIVPGESATLTLVGYNQNHQSVQVSASSWGTNAPASVATVTPGGTLTAVGASDSVYSVGAVYNGTTYTTNLLVRPQQAFVTGRVRTVSSTSALAGAVVRFFNNSGSEVGFATVNTSGNFRASVPTSATQFTLDISGVSNSGNYYDQFTYNNNDYLDETASCTATLPALTNGVSTPLVSDIVVTVKGPGTVPNPPGGCVNG